ncbi:hypothetical protein [Paenibacillus alginolyticus]|uniref:Uncharacterized protein n=1 Tax=Paenibacillus alginolyticus TaxID=59839 RepID=A0ABT4G5X9_9BACL|nr:hypothetical protein [Paenibacillus alginolyticus]MCY9691589.1 hypothetical protein [Paenibacillus alginolyticus]
MPTPMPNKLSVAMNRFTPGDKSRTKFTVYVHMDAPFLLLQYVLYLTWRRHPVQSISLEQARK